MIKKIKKLDLHTHTNISDGIYSPEELIDYAIREDIIALAITDHDTVDGLKRGMKYAKDKNFNLIPGVEFSLEFSGGSFHLVGLYVDYENDELNETVQKLQNVREDRARKMVEALKDSGIDISYDKVEKEVDGGAIGKPHIARVMVKMGYGNDMGDIFKNYMLRGKPGYVKKENIPIEEAVSVIKNAGGIPIIAHPASLKFNSFRKFENMVRELIAVDVKGIEVYSSMHSIEEVFLFYKVAKKYNLVISGGSDFHGDKNEKLGTYLPGKYIPYDELKEILECRKG